jgi:hypothetical protein
VSAPRVYAVLCVIGAVIPLYFFGSFVAAEGIDAEAAYDEITATDLSLFAWSDVFVAALAVIAFAVYERSKGLTTWWLAVVATLTVGVSLGLPLLLLLRRRASAD